MIETPDLPCPKCGSQRTTMKYHDGGGWMPDSEMPKLVKDWRERPIDVPLPTLRIVPITEDVVTG